MKLHEVNSTLTGNVELPENAGAASAGNVELPENAGTARAGNAELPENAGARARNMELHETSGVHV